VTQSVVLLHYKGAAALAASVTRTISIIVIVIELSQQLRLFFPALVQISQRANPFVSKTMTQRVRNFSFFCL
jgi:H+/Cl- antiporter ClcA